MEPAASRDPAIERVLAKATDRLAGLPGVAGVVLGGSRARGVQGPGSDIDLGLYYHPRRRPPFEQVLAAATELDDQHRPAGYGRYGAWGRGSTGEPG